MTPLPPPLEFGWHMKPLESAETKLRLLPDRRLELTIVHDVLQGVTPHMLEWWFKHIGGTMTYQGRVISRYRVWHPRDHMHWALAKPGPNGRAEAGAVFRIVEAFGRNPKHRIDVLETVEKLDDTGIRLSNRVGGFEVSNLEHTFTPVENGTLYRSKMLIGAEHPLVRPWFNAIVRPRVFPEDMARAWLLHNIEEVGNFEFFLPELYEAAASHKPVTDPRVPSSSTGGRR
jgi:DAPG hydrolase PhiG domain